MNTLLVILVVAASAALCTGLSRMLTRGDSSRSRRLGINALCLLLGLLLAVTGLKMLHRSGPETTPETASVSEELLREEVRRRWESHRYFALLEEADPDSARRVRARFEGMVRSALESGGTLRADDIGDVGDVAAAAAIPLVARASDRAVNDFAALTLEQMRALRDKDPKYCLMFLMPRAFPGERIPPGLTGMDSRRVLDVLAAILDSALHDPQQPPTREQAEAVLGGVLQSLLPKLAEEHGGERPVAEAFAAMSDPRLLAEVDNALVADVAIRFYEEIMQLPDVPRGQAVRVLFGGR